MPLSLISESFPCAFCSYRVCDLQRNVTATGLAREWTNHVLLPLCECRRSKRDEQAEVLGVRGAGPRQHRVSTSVFLLRHHRNQRIRELQREHLRDGVEAKRLLQ